MTDDIFADTGMINRSICQSGNYCRNCLLNVDGFRDKTMQAFNWDGVCPDGLTLDGVPSKIQQAKSVAKAVGRMAKAAIKGKPVLVSEEVKAERQAICDICEFYDAETPKCKKCGCRTAYKLKMATESCPINKWSNI